MMEIREFLKKRAKELHSDWDDVPGWVIEAALDFAKKVRDDDRRNVCEYAKLDFVPYDEEVWEPQRAITGNEIFDFYKDGKDTEWAVQQMLERDGFEINLNEDSILNAPKFKLL